MLKRAALLLAAVAVAAVGASPVAGAATGHAAKKHSVDIAVELATLSSKGNPPADGSTVGAGRTTGTYGLGAVVQTTTYGPQAGTFQGTGRFFTRHGSETYTLTGTGTANPDGSVSFSGHGRVTGGTAVFRHAHGRFHFTGTSPSVTTGQGTVVTFQVRGAIRY